MLINSEATDQYQILFTYHFFALVFFIIIFNTFNWTFKLRYSFDYIGFVIANRGRG